MKLQRESGKRSFPRLDFALRRQIIILILCRPKNCCLRYSFRKAIQAEQRRTMKTILPILLFAILLIGGVAPAQENRKRGMKAAESGLPPDAHELQIGDSAPDFSLKGIDDRTYSLVDFKGARLLMVVFLS